MITAAKIELPVNAAVHPLLFTGSALLPVARFDRLHGRC